MEYCIWKSFKLRLSPLEVFQALKGERGCFFLDSSLNSGPLARFSFLGIDPFYVLTADNEDPFPKLRSVLDKYRILKPAAGLPFSSGAVGFLSYDLGFILERKIRTLNKAASGIPNAHFGFYNAVAAVDHLKKRLFIFGSGYPEKNYSAAKKLAQANFRKLYNLIDAAASASKKNIKSRRLTGVEPISNTCRLDYLKAVSRAKEYIKAGDIYQVNLSQQFTAGCGLSAFEIYKRLRKVSPSDFSAYLDCGDYQILSSSPEGFLKLEQDTVTTRPMKGTRPRAHDRSKDRKLRNELIRSAKDKAELLMIVDLERNDLGRVCDYGSVKVSALREIEEYSTVFQTTATIQGRLHKGKDRIDLLRACFPGGSITGCPKIRAMEIIEELEPGRRSIYTGCLGYLSFCGRMDFNIMIRTILKKKEELCFGVGGGIVADSRPEEEYNETLVKARAMIEAIS